LLKYCVRKFDVVESVRNNDVDVKDLKNEVYHSIAVARYTKHFGFTGIRMNTEHPNLKLNTEHPNLKPFILLQFTTLNVNEVALVVTAVFCLLMKLRHCLKKFSVSQTHSYSTIDYHLLRMWST